MYWQTIDSVPDSDEPILVIGGTLLYEVYCDGPCVSPVVVRRSGVDTYIVETTDVYQVKVINPTHWMKIWPVTYYDNDGAIISKEHWDAIHSK